MRKDFDLQKLKEVVRSGMCFSCGACVFLDESRSSRMIPTERGPVPWFGNRKGEAVRDLALNPQEQSAKKSASNLKFFPTLSEVKENCKLCQYIKKKRAEKDVGFDTSSCREKKDIGFDKHQAVNLSRYCPSLGIDYSSLYPELPKNHLIGNYKKLYIGHSADPETRANSSSGGVITEVLRYLLDKDYVDEVITVRQGIPKPHLAQWSFISDPDELIHTSQSVYQPVSMLDSLREIDPTKRYAITLLPEQCAVLRLMQKDGIPEALAIKYVLGPYTGTTLYPSALDYFYKRLRLKDISELESIKWRAGEWPGGLLVTKKDGKSIFSKKIYYNFLIPFYITNSSLYTIDFANEFTDLSVGDAWHPTLESQGGGFSAVCVRSSQMMDIILQMIDEKRLSLDETIWEEAGKMHGHMLDFKKRGAFIRIRFRKVLGKPAPRYNIAPEKISLSRYLVELVNYSLFAICRTSPARWVLNLLPEPILGRVFNFLRLRWKSMSKPVKRSGLSTYRLKRI